MCGFLTVGSEEFSLEVFDEALGAVQGRGPDQCGYTYGLGKTWGFNRLAIMDLTSDGMQPFQYRGCMLVCNGEIYNYPALKENLKKRL